MTDFNELLSDEHPWTVTDIGRNTISSYVGDASKTFSIIPPPSITSSIRKIQKADFETYIKSLSDHIDKFTYNRAVGLDVVTEGIPELGDISFKTATSAKDRKRLNKNAGSLSDLPSIFFQESFNLGNPFTFSQVTMNAAITHGSHEENTTENINLQEKLSKYIDIVELHLVVEISKRSSSFFAALSNLEELNQETSLCMVAISDIRKELEDVLKGNAMKGIQLIQYHRKRTNINNLFTTIKIISEIRDAAPTIQILLRQGDYLTALDLISASQKNFEQTFLKESAILTMSSSKTSSAQAIPTPTHRKSNPSLNQIRPQQTILAIKNFNLQLNEMAKLIRKMTETDFTNIILHWVTPLVAKTTLKYDPLDHNLTTTFQGLMSGKYVSNLPGILSSERSSLTESLKNKIMHLCFGLVRMDRFLNALQSLKDALVNEAITSIKRFYPTTDESLPKPEKQQILADKLKSMNIEAYSNLLRNIMGLSLLFIEISQIIQDVIMLILQEAEARKIQIGKNAVLDDPSNDPYNDPLNEDEDDDFGTPDTFLSSSVGKANSMFSSPTTPSSPFDTASSFGHLLTETSNLIYSISSSIQNKLSKVLAVRIDQNALLNTKDFFWFYSFIFSFIKYSEDSSQRTVYGLKSGLASQAKAFLAVFHEAKMKQMALTIDSEQWNQAEIPIDFQMIVSQITAHSLAIESFQTSNENINTLSSSQDDLESPYDPHGGYDISKSLDSMTNKEAVTEKHLLIDNMPFYAVVSSLIFLKTLVDYLNCVNNLYLLNTEIINRFLELLKLFNSRTCQVILGAGAMRSAGLKNITARHISLASQSLGIAIQLIPHLRMILQSKTSETQQILLSDFDRLLQDFKVHQNELYQKLVVIMNDRLTFHLSNLKLVNWETPKESDIPLPQKPSSHMTFLVKEIITLHKVLSKYLNVEAMKAVIQEVFKSYKIRLEEQYKKIEIFSSSAKNRLLIDVQFYIQKLSGLENIEIPDNSLEIVINNMRIKDKRQQPPHSPTPEIKHNNNNTSPNKDEANKSLFSSKKYGMNLKW